MKRRYSERCLPRHRHLPLHSMARGQASLPRASFAHVLVALRRADAKTFCKIGTLVPEPHCGADSGLSSVEFEPSLLCHTSQTKEYLTNMSF